MLLAYQGLHALQVTTSAFSATFNLDSAGALYYIITSLPAPSVPVQPGTSVLASGSIAQPESLPAPASDSETVETVTVRGEDATVDVHVPTGRRLSSVMSKQVAAEVAGTTPWHDAIGLPSSYGQADWTGSVSHR